MSWGQDDRQYVSLCDGVAQLREPKVSYNSRMLVLTGGPHNARFGDLPNYPILASPRQRSGDPRYYCYGTLALDGCLYQFMSTLNHPLRRDPKFDGVVRFNGVKLIYSTDSGRTWRNQDGSTPVVWEPWELRSRRTMVFYEEDQGAFSLLTVLQMGRNNEHGRDGYVYVYAPNGYIDGTMNELVMFRVPKQRLLDRQSYEFFSGMRPNGNANWVANINERYPVHTFPHGWVNERAHPYAWQPSVVYNAPLGVYMMANWGMGTEEGVWFRRASYLGIWIAGTPWGPWTQIYEDTAWRPGGDENARAYQPQIAPKWLAADGRSFWLVWTDFQGADRPAMREFWEEYGRKASANEITEADIFRNWVLMRKHMPYYSFNTQRFDVSI